MADNELDYATREANELREAIVTYGRSNAPLPGAEEAQAFGLVDDALAETIAYMLDRKALPKNTRRERKLTALWLAAGRAVYPYDHKIANACMMKGLGWTDPSAWQRAKEIGLKIGIEDMQDARMHLNERGRFRELSDQSPSVPPWFRVAGLCFAAVTVLFLMFLIVGPPLVAQKRIVFDALVAFCASASAAFLGGDASARGQIPAFKRSPIAFSAYGGIGIFIVVFLILHYS